MRPTTSFYVERAMLLWPRLDRAKVRRFADDPNRIAEIVERRTSQPFDVILVMLTRQIPQPAAAPETPPAFDPGRVVTSRVALRIVRSEAGAEIQVQELVLA
jgi:hypothetical protein